MRLTQRCRFAILWTALSMCLLYGVSTLLDIRNGFTATIQKMEDWTKICGSSIDLIRNTLSEESTQNDTGKSVSFSENTALQQHQQRQQGEKQRQQQHQKVLVPPVYLCVNDNGGLVSICFLYGVSTLLDIRNGFYATIQKMEDWTKICGSSMDLIGNTLSEESTQNDTGKSVIFSENTALQQQHQQHQQGEKQLQQQHQKVLVPPVYLCVNDAGGLGDKLFEVAAMLGTARRYSITPAIPEEGGLHRIFKIPYTKLQKRNYSNFKSVNDPIPCTYIAIKANLTTNTTLKGHFQSWRYFSNVLPELKKSLIFVDDVRSTATDALLKFIREQHGNMSLHNRIFVGLYVRRADFIDDEDKVKFGYKIGTGKYIRTAMWFFAEKFKSVMFVVCSDNMKWTQNVVPHENATFCFNQSIEVDLAILSQCNHTIMTVGSFGWWAGWLAGGMTVYQRQQVREGSELASQFKLADYMLPYWIPIDETG